MITRSLYRSPAWRRLRQRIFKRDGYRCQQCSKAGRLEADHVNPVHKGGAFWDMGNLQTLCVGCHIRKSARENSERKRALMPEYRREWLTMVDELVKGN